MAARRRVAVFGGAFDPPTANHMIGAGEVVHSGLFDEVLLVPCGPRPDKPGLSSAVDRYIMVQLAVNTAFSADMPVRVSDVEVLEKEALATYDTLNALRKAQPECDFSFVIGTDWLQEGTDLRQWTSKCPDKGHQIITGHKLVDEYDFLVIRRPGYEVADLGSFGPRMKWLNMPEGVTLLEGNLSSTEIRKRTNAGGEAMRGTQFIEGLVTPAVLSYITWKRLYQSEQAKSQTDRQGAAQLERLYQFEQITKLFRNADNSQDGTLSPEDFKRLFLKLGKNSHTDEEMDALIKAANANGNGKVRYMEFLNFVMSPFRDLSPSPKRNVAILGGSFDPPTLSHVMSLAEIVNSGNADEVLMVPCGPRPDKPALRPALTRFTMCQLAVSSSFTPNMPVHTSDIEVFEPEALATYDALCALRARDPTSNFMFVIGTDWLQPGTDIRQWTSKCPVTGKQIVTGDKLLNEFDFLVIKRPGYEVDDLKSFGPRMKWMEMQKGMKPVEANMSSSEVRKRATKSYLQSGKLALIDGVVPPAVYGFVKREGIYRP